MLNSLIVSDNDTRNLTVLSRQNVLDKDFTVYGSVENPLFLAKDVAEWIDYAKTSKGAYNVSMMLNSIDDDEKLVSTILVSGQNRECSFVTENGLYEILMLSRKPIAKQFKKEVKKILHQIRMTGGYSVPRTFADALRLAAEQQERIALMQPKADFYDKVTGSSDTCDMKEVAKVLNFKNIGRNKVFEILREKEILDKTNVPYQKYIDAGYFRVIESKWEDQDGDTHINLKTVVYQKGVDYIRKIILKHPIYLSQAVDGAADSFIKKGEVEYKKIINKTADKFIDTELNSNPKSSCIFKSE